MPLPKVLRIFPLAFAVAACGNDPATAPPAPKAGAGGLALDAVQTVAVSAGEHDRFLSVAKGGKAVELARGVVVQGDGRVVVAGPVEHDPAASGDAAKDTDIALARFDTAGRLDQTFGDKGVVRLDLSAGVAEGAAFRGDTAWGLVRLTGDRLLVVGSQVAPGRTDVDFAVVRLTADGTKDAGFVTTGYGNDTAEARVDLIASNFTSDGALDRTFGTNGTTRIDVAGEDDRGRNLVALPDGRTVVVGSGKPTASNVDAMVVKLAADETVVARKLYDVGGPNDAFFGVALSPDGTRLAAVGYLGRDTSGSAKDDGAVLWLQP